MNETAAYIIGFALVIAFGILAYKRITKSRSGNIRRGGGGDSEQDGDRR